MKKNGAFRRAAALLAALSITVSLAAPAFADIYYIDDGDIIITKDENGRQTVKRGESDTNEIVDSGEIIITTREQTITTQESDLEGPAAEDSGFGPVVEDNYQPAQPEDAEEPKDDDQPESTKNRKMQTNRKAPTGRRALRNRKLPTSRRTLRSRRTLTGRKTQTSRQPRLMLSLQPLPRQMAFAKTSGRYQQMCR